MVSTDNMGTSSPSPRSRWFSKTAAKLRVLLGVIAEGDSASAVETPDRRRRFLARLNTTFSQHIRATGHKENSATILRFKALSDLERHLGSMMTLPQESWEQRKRLLLVVEDGLVNKDIVLSRSTVRTLGFAISSEVHDIADIVEHYVKNGEFIELFTALIAEEDVIRAAHTAHLKVIRTWVPVKLCQLYDLDMRMKEEAAKDRKDEGDDDKTMELPLEMRLHLSGFYDTDDVGDGYNVFGADKESVHVVE